MRDDVARFIAVTGLAPRERRAVPWGRSAGEVGIGFPSDYREFIEYVGPGELWGDLSVMAPWIHLPIDPGGFEAFVDYSVTGMGHELSKMRDESPSLCPYPIFPESGGLLEWGSNYNGDHCFWLTLDKDPNAWPIIVWLRGEYPSDPWRRYNIGVVEFLNLVIDGTDPIVRDLIYPREGPVWVAAD